MGSSPVRRLFQPAVDYPGRLSVGCASRAATTSCGAREDARAVSRPQNSRRISRRDFARSAALAAATAAALPAAILSDQAAGAALPSPQQESSQSKFSPESQAEVDARVEAIFRRYGSRLSEDQKKDIRRLATELQTPLLALRSSALANGEGPATIFVAGNGRSEDRSSRVEKRKTDRQRSRPASKKT